MLPATCRQRQAASLRSPELETARSVEIAAELLAIRTNGYLNTGVLQSRCKDWFRRGCHREHSVLDSVKFDLPTVETNNQIEDARVLNDANAMPWIETGQKSLLGLRHPLAEGFYQFRPFCHIIDLCRSKTRQR
jgi:hypothetical protein